MERDDRALALKWRELDMWLAQETGHSGTEWQLGLFVRIEGTVKPDLLTQAISKALQEAEPCGAAFFEVDGQAFQRAIDYPDAVLVFYDLSCSRHPVQEAYQLASSIQRTPKPFTGPLLKFALFRTRPDDYCWFACCHDIVIDGLGIALAGNRIASIYSAIVSGTLISPAFFGSPQDLVSSGLEYEASTDYLEDQAYWSRNLPSESEPDYRLPPAGGERDLYWPYAPVQLASLINETVRLIQTGVLGMSMQRPFISRTQLPGRLRRVYSHGRLSLRRPIGIGVSVTSDTRNSGRVANGRRRVGSTRRSQQANRIQTRLRNHRMRSGVSGRG
ncbi:MAG: condensation domain-containing protein [Mycobacterium sp.]